MSLQKGDEAIFTHNEPNVRPDLLNGGIFIVPGSVVLIESVMRGKFRIRVGDIVRDVLDTQLEEISR